MCGHRLGDPLGGDLQDLGCGRLLGQDAGPQSPTEITAVVVPSARRTGTATAATPSTTSLSSTLHPRATIWSN